MGTTHFTYAQEMRIEIIACRGTLRDVSRVLHHLPAAQEGVTRSIAQIDIQLERLGRLIGDRS
jgi:hypothetical protein